MERGAEHEHLKAVGARAGLAEALEELHDRRLVARVLAGGGRMR